MTNKVKKLKPGEILLKQYMKPMNLTQNALARAVGIAPRRINEIIQGKRAISLDTSVRLGRLFGQPPQFWLNAQGECDLRKAKHLIEQVRREVRPIVAA
jgi:addiction module HigA family antidote